VKDQIKLFFLILMFSGSIQAESQSVWRENYGVQLSEDEDPSRDEKYRWLYELLMPEEIRLAQPAETFKSFRVHLKDSNQHFPDPSFIASENLKLVQKVQGTMLYAGIVRKKYIYDLLEDSTGTLIHNVRVHLKGVQEADWVSFAEKMQQASEIWNAQRVETNFNYQFHFEIVRDAKTAHFSVQVLDSTRGPYDQSWGRDWTGKVVAHEVGHMMGLGDEYQTLSGKFDCYLPSLMCSAWNGGPMKHHYYFILRRLVSK